MAGTATLIGNEHHHGYRVDTYSVLVPSADVGALAAVTAVNSDATISGLTTADEVMAQCKTSTDGRIVLQAAFVQAANTLRLTFANPSAAAGTAGDRTVIVKVHKKS